MSETKEYIVSLNRGVDYDAFWDQIENASADDGFVPSRRVDIVNNRDGSLRMCHYALTDEEAAQLRNDPRVYDVEIPPEQRDDIFMKRRATQISDFTKTTSDTGSYVNWGLRRMIAESNPYSGNNTTGGYTYTLDGNGVDIIIQDSGIQADHPEFQDSNGSSRVQQIDWYAASGVSGTMPTNFYTDYDGHATHVAGIAAGKTYGWAKGANIYAQKLEGLEGSSDPGNGIPVSQAFDLIKLWHRNKPIDPSTGAKRPTVVNMSWGYFGTYTSVASVNYRGTSYSANTPAYMWNNYGIVPATNGLVYYTNTRVSTVDVDIQELIDEGVHVVIAAGNNYHKIDVPTGTDYNNYFISGGGSTFYYHRGSSPYDDEALIVGNIDSATHSGGLEQKAESSETGPGVNIWAPGTDIMSASSTNDEFAQPAQPYYLDPAYKQVNISGTSMAAPQIAGLACLYLQLNPDASPLVVRNWLQSQGKQNQIYSTGLTNDYNDLRSLQGSTNVFAFNPFNSPIQLRISGE